MIYEIVGWNEETGVFSVNDGKHLPRSTSTAIGSTRPTFALLFDTAEPDKALEFARRVFRGWRDGRDGRNFIIVSTNTESATVPYNVDGSPTTWRTKKKAVDPCPCGTGRERARCCGPRIDAAAALESRAAAGQRKGSDSE